MRNFSFFVFFLLIVPFVFSQSNLPVIGAAVFSTDRVHVGESVTFSGICSDIESALVVCKNNEACHLQSPAVRCSSDVTSAQEKSCSYTATDLDTGANDNDVATCCTAENLCGTTTVFVEPWVVSAAPQNVPIAADSDLARFPQNLRLRFEGGTVIPLNTTIVVGASAPSEDVLSAGLILNALLLPLNTRVSTVLDSDLTPEIAANDHLILIGNSSIHSQMESYASEETALPSYVSKILFTSTDRTHTIVLLGKDSFYRRKAAYVLANYQTYDLSSSPLCISGSPSILDDIVFVDCAHLDQVADPALPEYQPVIPPPPETVPSAQQMSLAPTSAECFDFQSLPFDCTSLLRQEDGESVQLMTSKGKEASVELLFSLNETPASFPRSVSVVFDASSSSDQSIPVYYRSNNVLKSLCVITPTTERVLETAVCDLPEITDDVLSLRLEGLSFGGNMRLRFDTVFVNVSVHDIPVSTSPPQLQNLTGTLTPQQTQQVRLRGACPAPSTKLIVCSPQQPCDLNHTASLLCQSEYTNDTIKTCNYDFLPGSLDFLEDYIGTCCTADGRCDTTPIVLKKYHIWPSLNDSFYRTGKGYYHFLNVTNIYPRTGSFSVETWIKPDVSHDGTILSTGEESPMQSYWALSSNFVDQNESHLSVRLNSGQGEVVGYSPLNILDGKWHHVVFVRDRLVNLVKIFIDGVFNSEINDLTTDIVDQSSSLRVGIGNIYQNEWFAGNVSDVSVYPTIISEAEINDSYHTTYRE